MRRSIVQPLLLLAAAGAAIWILAAAGPAGAAPLSPHILCPQERAHYISCCPVPTGSASDAQPVCCPVSSPACCPNAGTTCCTNGTPMCCTSGTPTCCASGGTACCTGTSCCPSSGCCTPVCNPSGLTISASPDPSKAGQKVVISGALATPTAGTTVVLWRELAGQTSFHQFSQTTTDSSGKYTFTVRQGTVLAAQQFYATANGSRSATVTQEVYALVGLAASARSTVVGEAIALRGHVRPGHAGERVLVEVRHGTAWHVIGRARLGRRSNYSLSHRFARSGTVQLRVVLLGDSRNLQSDSPTLKVRVKPS